MKLRVLSSVVVGVVLFAGIASADLDKKQASALRRAADAISDAERALADYGEGQKWGLLNERVEGDFGRKVDRAKKLLADLPTSDATVKAELDHLAKLETGIAAKVAERKGKEGVAASALGAIDALLSSPDYDTDLARGKAMAEEFSTPRWWGLDHYLWGRWTTHSDLERMRTWGKSWPQTQTDFTALRTKYAAVVVPRAKASNKQKQLAIVEIADEDANENFVAYGEAIKAFVKAAPAGLQADGKELLAQIEKAGSMSDWSAILNEDGSIEGYRNRLVNIPSVYATVASEADAAAINKIAKDITSQADAAVKKYETKIVATNTAPINAYTGADAGAIEALVKKQWKAKYPSEQLLAVRFRSSAFERTTEWTVDSGRTTLTKHDHSTLRVTVVVKNGKEAILWPIVVVKDHMKGDELGIIFAYRDSRGAPPTQRMLLANFK